ncbi:MAG: hypothetical protein JO307_25950 [Bryobacterales bacterium]|nr:hypothetical protein [Bryobacterales bacterium]
MPLQEEPGTIDGNRKRVRDALWAGDLLNRNFWRKLHVGFDEWSPGD